ncbi:unnamed protein product [Symbiodinium natans]|uniref:Ubiquitin-like domain-containing protein n=1 Tax=Symbiodinium natans TaxID=878477 RepID=A0A812MQR5_9DINO|nr:unnamed protein product [Symbiodinium natans]
MDINVIKLNGEEVATLHLDAAATVRDLKRAIAEVEGTSEILQQLVCKDRTLDDCISAPPLAAQLDGNAPVVLLKLDLLQVEDAEADKIIARYGRHYRPQHHFFWAVHEGNAVAIGGLLRQRGVDVNAEMLPTDFHDAHEEHSWPYCRFDGRYQDRALHLAVRCRDEATVETLLRHGADPGLRNDNRETAMDIAQGKGKKWKTAYLTPRDFGGSPAKIIQLLEEAAKK